MSLQNAVTEALRMARLTGVALDVPSYVQKCSQIYLARNKEHPEILFTSVVALARELEWDQRDGDPPHGTTPETLPVREFLSVGELETLGVAVWIFGDRFIWPQEGQSEAQLLQEVARDALDRELDLSHRLRRKADKINAMVEDINDIDELIATRASQRGQSTSGVNVSGPAAADGGLIEGLEK
ncbi:hypothetical protein PLICRDRAFT_180740 [Plicaturopsis crispa FD-325 SS-3]|uniref:Unplaced genomic scaffold PLICRscaffold_31, whole genome shotgun sequence n=1 Tax=Plicaturopsis crispa FD-325 SS-3 TaxID=944288 RepID=A0A0C9T4N4_PLICR|nr:hypothetical protein PLICRDRAFT_180740 [Plicaturopsis crispa FD-325 SS-3]